MPLGPWTVAPLQHFNVGPGFTVGDEHWWYYTWTKAGYDFAGAVRRAAGVVDYPRVVDASGTSFSHDPPDRWLISQPIVWVDLETNLDVAAFTGPFDPIAHGLDPLGTATSYETDGSAGVLTATIDWTSDVTELPGSGGLFPLGHEIVFRIIPPAAVTMNPTTRDLDWAGGLPPGYAGTPSWPELARWPNTPLGNWNPPGAATFTGYTFPVDQLIDGTVLALIAVPDWHERAGESGFYQPADINNDALFASVFGIRVHLAYQPPPYRLIYPAPWPLRQHQLPTPGMQKAGLLVSPLRQRQLPDW